jgi:hypothetical protein
VPPRDPLKLLATAAVALEREGVPDPGARLAMVRGWQTATLVVKNGELGAADLAAVRGFAEARSFDLVHLPGMRAEEADRFNRVGEPSFHAGARALLGPERDAFIERYKFDLRPATDDRPYAGDFFRWRALPEILSLHARGGAGLLEWGYLVLAATLAQAALLGAVLILLPLAGRGLREARGARGRTAAYFLAIGLAFLLVEIAFVQRFTLFLGDPTRAVAVVLAGFLVFAGVGSAAAPALARRLEGASGRARVPPIRAAAVAVALVAALYLAALPPVLDRLMPLPDAIKVPLALLLIAPLAVPMGMPFPLGLARTPPALVPWAWASTARPRCSAPCSRRSWRASSASGRWWSRQPCCTSRPPWPRAAGRRLPPSGRRGEHGRGPASGRAGRAPSGAGRAGRGRPAIGPLRQRPNLAGHRPAITGAACCRPPLDGYLTLATGDEGPRAKAAPEAYLTATSSRMPASGRSTSGQGWARSTVSNRGRRRQGRAMHGPPQLRRAWSLAVAHGSCITEPRPDRSGGAGRSASPNRTGRTGLASPWQEGLPLIEIGVLLPRRASRGPNGRRRHDRAQVPPAAV